MGYNMRNKPFHINVMRQFYTMHNTCNGVSHIGLGSGINILSSKSYKIGYKGLNVPYTFSLLCILLWNIILWDAWYYYQKHFHTLGMVCLYILCHIYSWHILTTRCLNTLWHEVCYLRLRHSSYLSYWDVYRHHLSLGLVMQSPL